MNLDYNHENSKKHAMNSSEFDFNRSRGIYLFIYLFSRRALDQRPLPLKSYIVCIALLSATALQRDDELARIRAEYIARLSLISQFIFRTSSFNVVPIHARQQWPCLACVALKLTGLQ